jgi:hypothetical protein
MATFGKTSSGASNTLHNTNRKTLSQATLTEDATLVSGTVRCRSNNATETKHWKFLVYADSGGAPGALVAVSDEQSFSDTSVNSRTANFAGEFLAAGTYWVGYTYDSNATTNVIVYRDNTANQTLSAVDTYSDGPSDPAGTMAALAGPLDAYVTYNPAGGGPARRLFLVS